MLKETIFYSYSLLGQQIVNDYTHKIVVKEDGTQSLIIVPALPTDSGEWTVIAQNRAGKTSVSMTLTVEGTVFLLCFFILISFSVRNQCNLICVCLFSLQQRNIYKDRSLSKNSKMSASKKATNWKWL